MTRLLLLVHRYLGIAIALMMAAWCLSGAVMMYVSYPEVSEPSRRSTLAPLNLSGCCNFAAVREQAAGASIESFRVEMLAGRPVLYASRDFGPSLNFDLVSGARIDSVDESVTRQVAAARASAGAASAPRLLNLIERDQWTVSGQYDEARPMYRYALGDSAGTEVYVSANTGEVVQQTTRRERFWNYLGAVTHWIYPTQLRKHIYPWSQLVIWLSAAGCFLALTGLYVGIARWRTGAQGAISPYRGWALWHHLAGLAFGVLALAWVGSGLVSMSPWGFLESEGAGVEAWSLRNTEITGEQMVDVVRRWAEQPTAAAQLRSAPFAGQLYLIEQRANDQRRLNALSMAAAPLTADSLTQAARLLRPEVRVADAALLASDDRYYYRAAHDYAARFPVFRVVLADAGRTRYYLDPEEGGLLLKVDGNGRWYRWLFSAPHQWNFAALLRIRPLWDVIVLSLLAGVTALCLTGAWMGIRRVRGWLL